MSNAAIDHIAATGERLQRSREALLAALDGVTEADFTAELDGRPLVELLAGLARKEIAAVATARALLTPAEGEPEATPTSDGPTAVGHAATLPPQAIHALAGARHRAARLLDELASAAWAEASEARRAALELLDAAAEREQLVAKRVVGRGDDA